MPQINLKILPDRPGIYLVGGTVRDWLLGRATADYDLAVSENASGVAEYIASGLGRRVVVIGRAGQHVYRISAGAQTYDVADIQGKDISSDLLRRDFTINAMGMDVRTGEIFDPAGGRNDLDARRVQMVSAGAFDADPLRLLRAFRMAAVLGFCVETKTLAEIARCSQKITGVAGERIRDEWLKMLESPNSAALLAQIDQAGLLDALFPEIQALRGCIQNHHHRLDAFDHTMQVYQALERMLHENKPELAFSLENRQLPAGADKLRLIKHVALIHDIGKPPTRSVDDDDKGTVHFYGHETKGAEMARAVSSRMRFSNAENAYAVFLVKNHLRPLFLHILNQSGKLKPETLTRFFMKTAPWTPDLLLLATADMTGKKTAAGAEFPAFARWVLDKYSGEYLPASHNPPLITGHDLIERFGLAPSPLIARILRKTEEKRLAGRLRNREDALALAAQMIDKQPNK